MSCEHERPVFGCQGCIERASVGMTLEDGGKTFLVEATKTSVTKFYIVAATKEQAEADAEELVDTLHFEEVDDSCYVTEGTPEPGDALWSGGPKGGWIDVPKEVTA